MEIPQPAPTLLDVRLQQEVGGPILPIFLLPICELLGHVLLHPFPRDLFAVRAREFAKEGLISGQPARFHQGRAHGQVGPAHGPAVRDGPQAMTDQEAEVPQDMEDRRRHGPGLPFVQWLVEEHQIDVRIRRQFAPAVAAQGDQRDTCRVERTRVFERVKVVQNVIRQVGQRRDGLHTARAAGMSGRDRLATRF